MSKAAKSVNRGDVFWINLDPTVGSEVKKCRPALVVSPDEMNHVLPIVIVAPLTSTYKPWPTRVRIEIDGRESQVMLEQLRTVDKSRLMDRMFSVDVSAFLVVLQKMFSS